MARTRWPPGPVNPGLLPRPGGSDRQRRRVPRAWAGRHQCAGQPRTGRQPVCRSDRDPGPTLRPDLRQTMEARSCRDAPLILPVEYGALGQAIRRSGTSCELKSERGARQTHAPAEGGPDPALTRIQRVCLMSSRHRFVKVATDRFSQHAAVTATTHGPSRPSPQLLLRVHGGHPRTTESHTDKPELTDPAVVVA
jgi:hypothetical protein